MTAGMDGLYTLNLHDMFFPDDNSSPSKKVDVLLPERASNEVSVKISDESPYNILNNAKDIFICTPVSKGCKIFQVTE